MSVIFECRSLAACRERALVLQAVGIAHEIIELDGWQALAVASRDASGAREQIRLYEHENHGWPPQLAQMPTVSNGIIGVMIYATILIVVHLMNQAGAFGQEWQTAGGEIRVSERGEPGAAADQASSALRCRAVG